MTDVDARADLSRLKLPELQALAAERGIVGASKLRKGELVDALSAEGAAAGSQNPEIGRAHV